MDPQKQEGFCEGDEMPQIWQEVSVDLQLMGPRGHSLESRTAVGQLGGHASITADISSVSVLVLEPEQTRSRSEWHKGKGNGKSFQLPRFCAIHIQAGLSLGTSAPSTGHRDEGRSVELSPFPLGRDQSVSGWNSPKSSSLLGFTAASCSRGQEIPSKQLHA